MTLGARIKEARKLKGWEVTDLSAATGIPYSTLKGIEDGHQATSTKTPTIAAALGVSPLWLAEGKGSRVQHADRQGNVKERVADYRQASQNEKLDEVILASAELWVRFEEGSGRTFQPVRRLQRKLEIAGMIEADGGSLTPEHSQQLIDAARKGKWDEADSGSSRG
jgi:transcriptional regulator with XRE-family HTH domain